MTKEREALKLALDWLVSGNFVYPTALRTAIEEALALTSTPCEVQPEAEAHLQAVSDFGQLQAQIEERNFCPRCGTRLMSALGPVSLHTCCPPTAPTGWDNGLSQDYDKKLGAWFSEKPNAKEELRARTFDDYGNKIV